jgi:hypothetical protein
MLLRVGYGRDNPKAGQKKLDIRFPTGPGPFTGLFSRNSPGNISRIQAFCNEDYRIIRCSAVTFPTSANIAAIGQSFARVWSMMFATSASSASALSVMVRWT